MLKKEKMETHFIVVLHDSAFKLGCVDPSYKVFHTPEKDIRFTKDKETTV